MKLIVLYGPPAAGKYTIAKAVAEKTGYKLFHNYLTVDLLKSVIRYTRLFSAQSKVLEIIETKS